jgi:hypothetical protein
LQILYHTHSDEIDHQPRTCRAASEVATGRGDATCAEKRSTGGTASGAVPGAALGGMATRTPGGSWQQAWEG